MIELKHQFRVDLPVEQTWALLTDLPRVATCLPGAALDDVVDGEYRGGLSTRIGPISAKYQGTASFRERDDVAHRAVIDARGREQKGSGSANALITAELKPVEGGTLVDVTTELNVSGRAAQFGRSLLAEVSNTMVDEFVRRLEVMIGGGDDSPPVSGPEPSAGDTGSGVTGSAALAQDDLDVVRTIVLPMLRKGLPAIAAALIAGLIGMVVGRRQRRVAGPGRIPVTYVLPYPEGRERASFLP
ncbi:SRPBCC family protein [Aeromicrobium sp. YIM 150415]|uniref:SRPBCC family protein n=1 Tax=Aeromicrobium sp. YIM 150415 TaxID=2803912 RepID=UPI001965F230|nr:SRPBCC family protein [Aeromicrobium sp. YIM 150415]MBM9462837.1 SRPBCC family protein [Aeromicrobium sp. YIM 150415]